MKPTPALSACSTYHLVASSEPTGRYETITSTSRSLRMPTMSAVGPGAFSMIWLRYLPRPSWVMPRSTVHAEVRDLLEDVGVVGLRVDRLGQVLADLVLVDVEGGHELDVADVVAAQVDVHQARARSRRPWRSRSSSGPGRGCSRSCRRRRSRRGSCRRRGGRRRPRRCPGSVPFLSAVLAVAAMRFAPAPVRSWVVRSLRGLVVVVIAVGNARRRHTKRSGVGEALRLEGVGRAGSALPRLGANVEDALDGRDGREDRDEAEGDRRGAAARGCASPERIDARPCRWARGSTSGPRRETRGRSRGWRSGPRAARGRRSPAQCPARSPGSRPWRGRS